MAGIIEKYGDVFDDSSSISCLSFWMKTLELGLENHFRLDKFFLTALIHGDTILSSLE